jgi:peptide/nickel transport system substrate-binding protein
MRRFIAAAIAACCVLGVLAACSKGGGTGVTPGVLRIGLPITPTQLNPLLIQNTSENFMASLLFSELVTVDPNGNEIPDLAETVPTLANGGISKDGLTLTYRLRHNVKWHDGVPFTSKDVAFSWRAVMNPNNNVVSRHGYDDVASVATPDPYTVVFHMKKVFAPAINTLFAESDTVLRVVPEHLLAKYPNINQVPFNSAPIGTGPFKFARWQRGDRIVLEANPNYFKGKPLLSQIIVKIIPDANTTEAELRTHEIDLALELTGTNYRSLANDPSVTRLIARAPTFTALYFNTKRAPFDNPSVRRAIALATDRDAITSNNTYGTGELAVADLSTYYWAFDPALKPLPHDVAQAAALLDRAGWKVGPSGIRQKDGKPLTLQLAYGQGSQLARNITAEVQSMLKGVGVDVQLKGYDYSILYASQEAGGIYNGGKFDIAMYAWVSGSDPDDSSQWLCSAMPPAGNNVTRYCSAEMDAAQHQALSTFDRTIRKKAYGKIESLLLRDVPGTFMYYLGQRFAFTPAFHGFAPNGISEGWNAYQWSI